MNKKQLYESIMRNVSREVKKVLNERELMIDSDFMPTMHILIDKSGSMTHNAIITNKIVSIIKGMVMDYATYNIKIWNCGGDWKDDMVDISNDTPLNNKMSIIKYNINNMSCVCGGTIIDTCINNIANNANDNDIYIVISDFEMDMRYFIKTLGFNGIIDNTTCITVDDYGDVRSCPATKFNY